MTRLRTIIRCLSLFAGVALASCAREATSPDLPTPPYLAIVAKQIGSDAPLTRDQYRYVVKELSGTYPVDTIIRTTPRDTIILSVRPATYGVSLSGLPPQCRSLFGDAQAVVVPEGINTAIARFTVVCEPLLTVAVRTDGLGADSSYIWTLRGTGPATSGITRTGVFAANDSLTVNDVPAGPYAVNLAHVGTTCVELISGITERQVTVSPTGGTRVLFDMRCADPQNQPTILSFQPSYHDSSAAFVAKVVSRQRSFQRFTFDVTDCQGRSLLPTGARTREGLQSDSDTLTLISAFEVGVADAAMNGACGTLRVEDFSGNVTAVASRPLQDTPSARPRVTRFNAVLNGEFTLRLQLDAVDDDGDLVGSFAAFRLLDGALSGTQDGKPDIGILNTQGFLGTVLPDLPLGTRVNFRDVLGAIVYVIDARGNFTRVVDNDTFQ